MSEIGRQIHFQAIVFAGAFEGNYLRRAIDVPLDEMPAERRARQQRALQIYRTVAPEEPQVRAVERFLEQIERQLWPALAADR